MEPDFYLISTDAYPALEPRKCYIKKRIKATDRTEDYLLVDIVPNLNVISDDGVQTVVLSTRHKEQSLFPISKWPAYIYLCEIINQNILITNEATSIDLIIILWGELYLNYDEADRKYLKFKKQIEE